MRLYEISPISPTIHSLNKRWFTCREMNLIVGTNKNMPVNFKLSFKRSGVIQTLSWDIEHGFSPCADHTAKADSEQHRKPSIFRYEQSDLAIIRRDFLAACENIDIDLTDFIYARLMEYPAIHSQLYASHTGHPVAW